MKIKYFFALPHSQRKVFLIERIKEQIQIPHDYSTLFEHFFKFNHFYVISCDVVFLILRTEMNIKLKFKTSNRVRNQAVI